MFRCKDFKILVLVPSPAMDPQVTAGRLLSLSVPPDPGRESTACFSAVSVRVAKYWDMHWLRSYNPSCISPQAESVCWCPVPRWALRCKERSCLVFSCLDGRNLPKQGGPAQSIPPPQALRWYPLRGRGRWRGTAQRSRPTTGDPVCGGTAPRVTRASGCRSPGQGWPLAMGPRSRGFGVLRELSEFSRPGTVKGKNSLDRKIEETVSMVSYMSVHPAGPPWRGHLQCLQGWPLSSV